MQNRETGTVGKLPIPIGSPKAYSHNRHTYQQQPTQHRPKREGAPICFVGGVGFGGEGLTGLRVAAEGGDGIFRCEAESGEIFHQGALFDGQGPLAADAVGGRKVGDFIRMRAPELLPEAVGAGPACNGSFAQVDGFLPADFGMRFGGCSPGSAGAAKEQSYP